MLRPGTSSYGVSASIGAQIGFRFHPLVSGGLRGDIATVSADAPSDGTTNLSRGWQSAGLYVRAYPLAMNDSLRRTIDPWIATGLLYVHDGQRFDRGAMSRNRPIDVSWQVDHHALGVPLGAGVDFRMTKWLSVGPSFEYVLMSPVGTCVKASSSSIEQEQRLCSSDSSGKDVLTMSKAGMFSFGLGVRATPF